MGYHWRIGSYQLPHTHQHPHPTPPLPSPLASLRRLPISADREGLGFVFTPLVLLQQLNAVVAVELDGSPVAVVADQQRALLQAALAVRFGGHSEFGDVLGQVLFDGRPLRLRPGTLQDTSLSYRGRQENGGRLRLASFSHGIHGQTSQKSCFVKATTQLEGRFGAFSKCAGNRRNGTKHLM